MNKQLCGCAFCLFETGYNFLKEKFMYIDSLLLVLLISNAVMGKVTRLFLGKSKACA